MRYVSLFSGVEAATVAWSNLGWQPLAFAEIDPFPCAVLAQRFPDVPNLGDVSGIDWEEFHARYGAIDVLIGGSPCQSFSIAGGREGLKGESRLMYEYVRAVRELVRASGGGSPRYIVWENVPGCLSSNQGRDFGCLLDELEECGYFVAWRTLDSQYARVFDRSSGRFGRPVPQRRRRVYLVGSLSGPSAAEILFERQSLCGNNPKSREAREAFAEDVGECPEMGDRARLKRHDGASRLASDAITPWDVQSKRIYAVNGTSPMLNSGTSEGMNIQPIILTTANTGANGCNYSDEGCAYTLDRTNCNAVAYAQSAQDEEQVVNAASAQPGVKQQSYVCIEGNQAKAVIIEGGESPTLNASHEQPIIIDRAAFNQGENAKYPPHIEESDVMDTLVARGPHAVAFRQQRGNHGSLHVED